MISGVWRPIAAMSRVSLAQAHSKGESYDWHSHWSFKLYNRMPSNGGRSPEILKHCLSRTSERPAPGLL